MGVYAITLLICIRKCVNNGVLFENPPACFARSTLRADSSFNLLPEREKEEDSAEVVQILCILLSKNLDNEIHNFRFDSGLNCFLMRTVELTY